MENLDQMLQTVRFLIESDEPEVLVREIARLALRKSIDGKVEARARWGRAADLLDEVEPELAQGDAKLKEGKAAADE